MIVSNNLQGLKGQVGAIALGMFDGVHLGHGKILDEAIKLASRSGQRSAVFTFHPHPVQALGLKVHLLTSPAQRRSLMAGRGIDILIEHPFTTEFSQQTPQTFVELLAENLGNVDLVVGFNYSFGRKATGNVATLKELATVYGMVVHELPAVEIDGKVVSSTRVRNLIEQGDLLEAARCLNRPFSLQGKVVKGDGRGRTLGFPTANLHFSHMPVLPPYGVYVVRSPLYGFGVGNLGVRPTFPLKEPNFEVFFHEKEITHSLYDEELEVELITHLRGEKRFSSPAELRNQVLLDLDRAKLISLQYLIPDDGSATMI